MKGIILAGGSGTRLHVQKRQNTQVACLEEIAFQQGFIDRDQFRQRGHMFSKTAYGRYLLDLAATG